MYDTAVFKTKQELEGASLDSIQAYIEQPELHMLAVCSSAVEDQAALTGDRISCISDLSTPLYDSRGTEVTDKLVFFYGDKAAQQVERGTQQGGTYKCGSCGCEWTTLHIACDAHAAHSQICRLWLWQESMGNSQVSSDHFRPYLPGKS